MNKPVIVEEHYAVGADMIWKALTDPREMKQWYFDIPDFKAEKGHQFSFEAGDGKKMFVHRCEVTEVNPGKKIAYTWRYDFDPANTLVSFELFPEKQGTLVRITHEGLDDFDPGNTDLARENFVKGWTGFLKTNLRNYLEKKQP
jgi:uncharacterized protein YndB with AHSA1/START domain